MYGISLININNMLNNLKKIIVKVLPFIEKYVYVNRGLDIEKELQQQKEKEHEDDFMGSDTPRFNWEVVKDDGDWTKEAQEIFMEVQNDMDCTGHGMKNALEMLLLGKFGIKMNISAAYINYMAGTDKYRGNSLNNILRAISNYGWVTDEEWPEANRWKKPTPDVIDKGIMRVKKEFVFGYDIVYNTIKGRAEALKYSPLFTGGFAWYKSGNVYISYSRANHCFDNILAIVKDTGGTYNRVKDSYNPTIKHLADDYSFLTPRRLYLAKRDLEFNQVEIDKFRKDRGWEYVVLVENFMNFTKGVYQLLEDGLKKVELPDAVSKWIIAQKEDGKLDGINAESFSKLLK